MPIIFYLGNALVFLALEDSLSFLHQPAIFTKMSALLSSFADGEYENCLKY